MNEPWLTLVMLVTAFLAAVLSWSAGFGGAMVMLPILSWELGPERAVPLLAIAQLASNGSRAGLGAKSIAWSPVAIYSVGALPASVLGALLFTASPAEWLRIGIGSFVGIVSIHFVVRARRGDPSVIEGLHSGRLDLALRGAAVGFVAAIAGTAGPLGNAVFLRLRLTPVAYVASEAAATCVIHAAKLVVFGGANLIAAADMPRGLSLAAAMVLGTYAGKRLLDDVPRDRFVAPVGTLMFVAGLAMIAQGLHALPALERDVAPE